MKNRRLKMTLLELLDASPRLKKRLASMSLSSGKPIFQIDGLNQKEIDDATSQILPSIFFIKNLLKTSPENLSKLRRKGQLISFLRLDSEVNKSFLQTPMHQTLKDIHCCMLYSNVAPLINRLILGALSQAMSSIAFTINPFDYLYWGSWFGSWDTQASATLDEFTKQVGKDIYLSDKVLAPFNFLATLPKHTQKFNDLVPQSFDIGCDGTLVVGSVKYVISNTNADYVLEIQRALLQSQLNYLAIDCSELSNGILTVSSFVPLLDESDSERFKLCIILNNDNVDQQIVSQHKAG